MTTDDLNLVSCVSVRSLVARSLARSKRPSIQLIRMGRSWLDGLAAGLAGGRSVAQSVAPQILALWTYRLIRNTTGPFGEVHCLKPRLTPATAAAAAVALAAAGTVDDVDCRQWHRRRRVVPRLGHPWN